MPYAQVTGWGKYVPSRVLTNDTLVQMGLETSDDWIVSRTGIRQRRLIAHGEATSDMAVKAGQQALDVAGIGPGDLDLVIVATCTPDHLLPATASLVQERIGAFRAGAMDINAVCSGFVYGLVIGAGQIEAGRSRRVLVVGADTLSPYVDWRDRNTCVLFGDGAGAVVLAPSAEPGVLAGSLGSDGSGADLLMVPAGGSRQPPNPNSLVNGDHHIKMNGPQVFRFATQMLAKSGEKVVGASGLRMADVDLLIPHQANLRIIETTARKLRVPMERVFVNVDRYGNTSAASIPIAFCEAIQEGRVKPGDNVLLSSFGAGLTWAAAVVHWGRAPKRRRSAWSRLGSLAGAVGSALLRRGRRARRHINLPVP